MVTARRLVRELLVVAAVGVVVSLIVAVGLVGAIKVALFSLQDTQGGGGHVSAQGGDGAAASGAAPSTLAGLSSRSTHGASARTIRLDSASAAASPHDIVRLTGRVPAPASRERLQVQVLAPRGWITYPLPAVSDRAGRFTAFVELGRLGPNRLRVIDPANGHVSNEVTVTVS
jgi:hypothetical protein